MKEIWKDVVGYEDLYQVSNYGECLSKIAKKLSKPVIQFDLNGNIVRRYESISDASRKTGYNISFISDCCNNKYLKAYGYFWEFDNGEG